jgi:hypothetical protein
VDPQTLASALQSELSAARQLLNDGRALTAAMRAGAKPEEIEPLVARYASALETARSAAQRRASYLSGAGELARWIAATRPENARALTALGEEARALRDQIRRETEHAAYLARRVAGWYEAQRAWIVELVAREVEPTGYGTASRSSLASAVDRSA